MGGYYLLVWVLVTAPLFRGGNRPVALLLLELATVALAAYVVWKPKFFQHLSRPAIFLLGLMCVFPLLQLLPIPYDIWRILPGHELYGHALASLGGNFTSVSYRPASLVPALTEYSWLALLPPMAVFLYTIGLPSERLRNVVYLFLGIAIFQVVIGLMQYGVGPENPLRGNLFAEGSSAVGTYANYNHLAGLIEMALPLAIALFIATLSSLHFSHKHSKKFLTKLSIFASFYMNRTIVFGLLAAVLLTGLIFTKSRTGIMLGILVIMLCTIAFSARIGRSKASGLIGTISFIGASLAIQIGLVPVLNRFSLADPLHDARWSIFTSTVTAIGEFFPLGSGAGTFSQVYQRFHSPDILGVFVNRAHNDYLEWVMEGGVIAAVLIVGLILLYLVQWLRVWKRGEWTTLNFIQVGAGIGILAILLHSLVDYNLHIPANQIYLALLAALFFHRGNIRENEPIKSGTSSVQEEHEQISALPPQKIHKPLPGPNPFAN